MWGYTSWANTRFEKEFTQIILECFAAPHLTYCRAWKCASVLKRRCIPKVWWVISEERLMSENVQRTRRFVRATNAWWCVCKHMLACTSSLQYARIYVGAHTCKLTFMISMHTWDSKGRLHSKCHTVAYSATSCVASWWAFLRSTDRGQQERATQNIPTTKKSSVSCQHIKRSERKGWGRVFEEKRGVRDGELKTEGQEDIRTWGYKRGAWLTFRAFSIISALSSKNSLLISSLAFCEHDRPFSLIFFSDSTFRL